MLLSLSLSLRLNFAFNILSTFNITCLYSLELALHFICFYMGKHLCFAPVHLWLVGWKSGKFYHNVRVHGLVLLIFRVVIELDWWSRTESDNLTSSPVQTLGWAESFFLPFCQYQFCKNTTSPPWSRKADRLALLVLARPIQRCQLTRRCREV